MKTCNLDWQPFHEWNTVEGEADSLATILLHSNGGQWAISGDRVVVMQRLGNGRAEMLDCIVRRTAIVQADHMTARRPRGARRAQTNRRTK